jgi:hypothetical protein
MLTSGAVLSAFTNPFAGQWVFADSVEPGTVEAGLDASARCNPEDIAVYGPQFPPTSERPCPARTNARILHCSIALPLQRSYLSGGEFATWGFFREP